MQHPGQLLQQELTARGLTQKTFASMIGKKISEVNELIKGKRNITVQRDILLSVIFDDPEQKWLVLQNNYDYVITKTNMQSKIQELLASRGQSPKIVESIPPQTPIEIIQPDPASSTTIPPKSKAHKVFEDF